MSDASASDATFSNNVFVITWLSFIHGLRVAYDDHLWIIRLNRGRTWACVSDISASAVTSLE